MKLTVLNPAGRIWTMVAGGGASVVYSDTIAEFLGELSFSIYAVVNGVRYHSLLHSEETRTLRRRLLQI